MKTGIKSEAAFRHQKQIAELVDAISDYTKALTENFENALKHKDIMCQAKALYITLRDNLSALRTAVDTLETFMPKDEWPTPSYTDLLFYL